MAANILENINTPAEGPQFHARVFSAVAKIAKGTLSPIEKVLREEFDAYSQRLDRSFFQESCSVRNVLRTRQLAELLVADDGQLNLPYVEEAVQILKRSCYSLGPNRQYDTVRQLHLLHALEQLAKDPELQREIRNFSRPYSNKIADQVIRDTLRLPANRTPTDADVKKAALSAWFCYLRQNVGSCFATAPAIIVQKEQPIAFFKDLRELLETGRLKRTFGGNEYAAPMSSSAGAGEFKKRVLLHRKDKQIVENISYSPGLMHALEAVGLVDAALPLKERIQGVAKLLSAMIEGAALQKDYLVLSAEEILQAILMAHYQITAKDLQEYENRPRVPVQSEIHLNIAGASPLKNKMAVCGQFQMQMKLARGAFNALTDNALLKMWEFSLASFAETKPGFTRWNMYASLGFNYDQPGGIADVLYRDIKMRLERANERVRELQGEYEIVYSQLKFIEGRLRQASSEKEAQWGRIEYESKRSEFRTLEELRDREHFKAERFANLYNDLLSVYDSLFPRYFQEVYDPDMHEVAAGPYDDSPAGFRLLFKHGRENTSQWTLIYTPQEFTDYLSSFFVMTEPEIVNDPDFQGLEQELSQIITNLVAHVKTEEFILSAFYRMAIAHQVPMIKDPLEHLDRIEKKPWAYTSGGTMNNLLSCYFRIDGGPKVVERWVENPLELLVFFIDTAKQIPFPVLEKYLKFPQYSLLMHSPTHAFTFHPGFPLLKKAIEAEGFTYTWVRDQLVRPMETFNEYMFLDQEMMGVILSKLKTLVPEPLRARFETVTSDCYGKKNPREFRRYLEEALDRDPLLAMAEREAIALDQIDSALYHWLPLTSRFEWRNRAEKIMEKLPGLDRAQHQALSEIFEGINEKWEKEPYLTADQLQSLCKAALSILLKDVVAPYDYPLLISQEAQKLGYAMPEPILFGDSNWVKEWFAFIVNPGTSSLELWRIDPLGRVGAPMSQWKQWLNGSDRSRTWGIFTKPQEYAGT